MMESQIAVSETIDRLLKDRTLGEWEFLYIPTSVMFRTSMTPERIRTSYEFRYAVRYPGGDSKRMTALSKALRTANLDRAAASMDVRYALTVRDNRQKDVAVFFMDFSNRVLSINGTTYRANSELAKWFQDLARDLIALA